MGSRTSSMPGSRCGDVLSAACRRAIGLSMEMDAGRGGRGSEAVGRRCGGVGRWRCVDGVCLGADEDSEGSTNHGRGVTGEDEDDAVARLRFAVSKQTCR